MLLKVYYLLKEKKKESLPPSSEHRIHLDIGFRSEPSSIYKDWKKKKEKSWCIILCIYFLPFRIQFRWQNIFFLHIFILTNCKKSFFWQLCDIQFRALFNFSAVNRSTDRRKHIEAVNGIQHRCMSWLAWLFLFSLLVAELCFFSAVLGAFSMHWYHHGSMTRLIDLPWAYKKTI